MKAEALRTHIEISEAEAIRVHREWQWNEGKISSWRRRAAYHAWLQFCTAHDAELARRHDWIVAKRDFEFGELWSRSLQARAIKRPQCIDHQTCFRLPVRPYRPIAILSHSYLDHASIIKEATEAGLHAQFLPWSCYNPGQTIAVLLTRTTE